MQAVLRSVWNDPRPANPPARVWRDWALLAVLLPLTVVEGALRSGLTWRVVGSAVLLAKSALTATSGAAALSSAVAGMAVLSSMMALGAVLRFRARARQRELAQVQLMERERPARDLHDTVAHHVSAIAIRAQAGLAMAPAHPGAATDALEVISAEASRTLTEMREMLQVLRRNEPADRAPTPQIADLAQLAGRACTGPPVEVQITGDVASVSPSVGAAVYRLAQESVTNARRHARHATRIQVRVAADETAVRLQVSDDGETTPGRTPVSGGDTGSGGYGLIGMIERALLLGGSCQADPDPERGWTVTAVLPLTGCGA